MPFTPPATNASKANTGYQSQFFTGSSASPPAYTAILEVKSFSNDLISIPEVPTTHLLSPLNTEEFSPGMIKPGKIQVGGNFIGDATQLNFTALAQGQTIFPFKVTAPVQQNSKTYTLTGQGFIVGYKNGPFETNKAIEYMVDIQMTGAYTETVA
jgi:hypothetical protein